MLKRVLVPLDGSDLALKALPYAKEIAKHFNAEVILLQVIPETTPPPEALEMAAKSIIPATGQIAVHHVLEEKSEKRQEADNHLEQIAGEIRSEDIKVSHQVIFGDPGDSIIDFADKENIDTIIMTTSGKGGVERFMLGSVADTVIHKTRKPVTVIR